MMKKQRLEELTDIILQELSRDWLSSSEKGRLYLATWGDEVINRTVQLIKRGDLKVKIEFPVSKSRRR